MLSTATLEVERERARNTFCSICTTPLEHKFFTLQKERSPPMNIPNDPMMLLSFINTKLRDDYKDLSTLCYELELEESAITDKLSSIDYTYDANLNRFV
jgi:hypothetical protein